MRFMQQCRCRYRNRQAFGFRLVMLGLFQRHPMKRLPWRSLRKRLMDALALGGKALPIDQLTQDTFQVSLVRVVQTAQTGMGLSICLDLGPQR